MNWKLKNLTDFLKKSHVGRVDKNSIRVWICLMKKMQNFNALLLNEDEIPASGWKDCFMYFVCISL